MTTEYRDGTVADLQPGDGFSYYVQDVPRYEVGEGITCRKSKADPSATIGATSDRWCRIWPGYFKDKEPAFDVEAFRATVKAWSDRPNILDARYNALVDVLELLPPKPQPTLEDELRSWMTSFLGPTNTSDRLPELLAIVERHQS